MIIEVLKHFIINIEYLLISEKIDAIALTPPSISRKHQVLEILDKMLPSSLPRISLLKHSETSILIPQKSLRSPADRIENTQKTIFIKDSKLTLYHNVLLIDDFIGSGATLNETAKKLLTSGVKKVIGFAFFGNLDLSYEVINEM